MSGARNSLDTSLSLGARYRAFGIYARSCTDVWNSLVQKRMRTSGFRCGRIPGVEAQYKAREFPQEYKRTFCLAGKPAKKVRCPKERDPGVVVITDAGRAVGVVFPREETVDLMINRPKVPLQI